MRIADGLLPELDPPSLLSGFGAGLTVVVIGGFFWSLAQMMTGMALTLGADAEHGLHRGDRSRQRRARQRLPIRFARHGPGSAGLLHGGFFCGAPRSSVSWAACPASRSIPSAFGSSSATKHIGRTP